MSPQIINVSLSSKFKSLSYPIFVGNNLLSNCEEILKQFVFSRKVILIHDNFFSLETGGEENFIAFVTTTFKLSSMH